MYIESRYRLKFAWFHVNEKEKIVKKRKNNNHKKHLGIWYVDRYFSPKFGSNSLDAFQDSGY